MGNHRCCCKKGCRVWYDDFTRVEDETAPDGINRLGSTRYSGALSDWHIAAGKLVADVADSQINFHDGGKRIWHVGANITLPNVGDYLNLHYDAHEAKIERIGASLYETTMAGESWQATVGGSDVQFSTMFFPRAKHAYYYDRFTTTPDSDLVAAGLFYLTGSGGTFVCRSKPAFTLTGVPAALQNVGRGFSVWGFSGSAGVSIDDLDLVRSKRECWEMLHGCCSGCWPAGLADTAIVTATGFSGTYTASGFNTCNRSYFNGTHVCDPDPTTAGCSYKKSITYSGTPACDNLIGVQLFFSDDVADQFLATVIATWSGSPSWSSAEFSRQDLCDGVDIPLTPDTGSPTGTLTLRFV